MADVAIKCDPATGTSGEDILEQTLAAGRGRPEMGVWYMTTLLSLSILVSYLDRANVGFAKLAIPRQQVRKSDHTKIHGRKAESRAHQPP